LLKQYRRELDGMDSALMEQMAKRWLLVENGLASDIAALAFEFERRAAAGEVITQQMVWRAERYQILKSQLQEQVKTYNKTYAVDAIEAAQKQFFEVGIESAQAGIFASFDGVGMVPSFGRVNKSAVESMIGFAKDGTPLSKLLENDYPDAVDGLTQALVNGLARGLGPGQIAKNMSDGMGMGIDRALLIARTEAARAYRTASTEQYRESGVVTGFMRLVKKETACIACLLLDGERLEIESELDDHPRGKCMLIAIIPGANLPQWEHGKEWLLNQSAPRQQEIIGSARYQLWQDGQINLTDMVSKTHDPTWGSAPKIVPIMDLVSR